MTQINLQEKIITLQGILTEYAPLLIAYSGGVDSALLAAISLEILGPSQFFCITIDGPELPRHGLKEAITMVETLGLPLEVVTGESLTEDLKRENPHDRCRYCKLGSFQILKAAATRHGCKSIADGANASDLGEHRPGISAFTSCGVIHPFIMAEITKADIREIARIKGLPFWDKPSSACLYSRIPYGEEITSQKLIMVEQAEDFLMGLDFHQVRVRHHGRIARIEIPPEEIPRIVPFAQQIDENFRNIGFSYVTLDLRGYRSGSMDEVLREIPHK